MKLIDILVRDLKEWPENLNDHLAPAVAQDDDGLLVSLDDGCLPNKSHFSGGTWSRIAWTGDDMHLELAEDHPSAVITQAEWQAAVDALKQTEALAAWAGDSVPPIGIACEVTNHITGGWDVVDEVLAHTILKGKLVAVFRRAESIHYSPADTFRTIRSPEQIQADARQAGIEALNNDINGRLDFNFNIDEIQGLYDGGYRAPESAQ